MTAQIWQYDERVGCVAVYHGRKRECLSGIQDNPACVFFKPGTWVDGDHGSYWEVAADDIRHGRLLAALLNSLEQIADGVCEINHPPECCNCASQCAMSAVAEARDEIDQKENSER